MLAVAASDLRAVGGYDVANFGTTWGGEDVDLAGRLRAAGVALLRVREPFLAHVWHPPAGWKVGADGGCGGNAACIKTNARDHGPRSRWRRALQAK